VTVSSVGARGRSGCCRAPSLGDERPRSSAPAIPGLHRGAAAMVSSSPWPGSPRGRGAPPPPSADRAVPQRLGTPWTATRARAEALHGEAGLLQEPRPLLRGRPPDAALGSPARGAAGPRSRPGGGAAQRHPLVGACWSTMRSPSSPRNQEGVADLRTSKRGGGGPVRRRSPPDGGGGGSRGRSPASGSRPPRSPRGEGRRLLVREDRLPVAVSTAAWTSEGRQADLRLRRVHVHVHVAWDHRQHPGRLAVDDSPSSPARTA
jgi:hypothetical protein